MNGKIIAIDTREKEFENKLRKLKAGDVIMLSGIMHTMRDRAHKRAVELLEEGRKLPFEIKVVFHASPIIVNNRIISIGPTTSARMEKETKKLLGKTGLVMVLGKGGMGRSTFGKKGIYCALTGGAGAYYAQFLRIKKKYWRDLGAETVYELEARKVPALVAIAKGKNLYALL